MTDFRLVLQPGSLEVTPRGIVTGQIYFTFDSKAFPDDSWSDFVLVVLGWWSKALATCVAGGDGEVELAFMEGPFVVRLRQYTGEDYEAEFVDRSRNHVHGRAPVHLPDLLRAVSDAANVVLSFSEQGNASTADIEALRLALRGIKR